ncbi:MAG: hypothetical protein IKN14_08435 [Clostridiales bacterium]|nr:hypothetical protein [Clostridiales bacterium]
MKKSLAGRAISVITAGCVLMSYAPLVIADPQDTDDVYVTKGTYEYTSNEGSNKQATDTFTYRDDCFMRSSYLGCCHLEELSASLALSSASRYGNGEDKDEKDPSDNAQNVMTLLSDMGFENVSTNEYYTLEKLENSCGCAVGMRTIKAHGKTYTLLAVVPRSANYKQEWAGNFTVGSGDIHDGFKQGRDEILRYVKKYIADNGITGDLKIWTVGHSRGAAMANMVGGFFADGGGAYLGDSVSVAPEDVYCYTYATPRTIKNGASRAEALSVSGARADHPNDTSGEAYVSTATGTTDTGSEVFDCIRNYPLAYDMITMLPPEAWGFGYYGQVIPPDSENASYQDMMDELKTISPYAYEYTKTGGNPSDYSGYDFDLPSLSIVKRNDEGGSMEKMFLERFTGLIHPARTNAEYVSGGYQNVLKSIAGIYGLLLPLFDTINTDSLSDYLRPALFTYLAYATERIIAENPTYDEKKASAVVFEKLITHFTGEAIDPENYTFNDFFEDLTVYLAANRDSEMFNKAVDAVSGLIPADYEDMFLMVFTGVVPGKDYFNPEKKATVRECVEALIIACAEGGAEGSAMSDTSAKDMRAAVIGLLALAMGPDYPVIMGAVDYGNGKFEDVVAAILKELMTIKDEDKNVLRQYDNLTDAANGELPIMIDSILGPMAERTTALYGQAYHDDVVGHIETIKNNIPITRLLITSFLFYTEGEAYDPVSDLRNALGVIGNAHIVAPSHFNENYAAWARAVRRNTTDDHYITRVDAVPETCTEDGTVEYYILRDEGKETIYDDMYLTNELSENDLVIPATDHDWSEWEIVKPATATEEGLMRRVCSNDPSHIEEKTIPPEGDDSSETTPTTTPTDAPTSTATATPTPTPTEAPKNAAVATGEGMASSVYAAIGLIAVSCALFKISGRSKDEDA